MRIRSGNIPKDLIYFWGHKKTIKISWEDTEDEEGDIDVTEDVFPTFVSDATNEKTCATGRAWAQSNNSTWDPVKRQWVQAKVKLEEKTRKNEPMSKLRIYNLEVRGNGGRAWKCGDQDGHYFDLREDVLLDLMRTEGISPGGYLNGEYIWAKIHAEMKIVRVGSELHKALEQSTTRRELPNIHKKDLVPWHIYQEKSGKTYLFVGTCTHFEVSKEQIEKMTGDELQLRMWENVLREEEDNKVRAAAQPHNSGWGYGPRDYMSRDYRAKFGRLTPPSGNPIRAELKYDRKNGNFWIPLEHNVWSDSASMAENLKKAKEYVVGLFTMKPSQADQHYYFNALENGSIGYQDPKVVTKLEKLEIPELFENFHSQAIVYKDAAVKKIFDGKASVLFKERERLKAVAKWFPFGTMVPKGQETSEDCLDYWSTEIITREPK